MQGLCLLLLLSVSTACERTSTSDARSETQAGGGVADIDRAIRILLLDDLSAIHVRVKKPFDLVDVSTGNPLAQSRSVRNLHIVFEDEHIGFAPLGWACESQAVDLVTQDKATVEIELNGVPRHFHGLVRFLRRSPGKGAIINVLDIEDYLVGVVAAEMPLTFHQEALRAQAIVARTYAWFQKQTTGQNRDWDMWGTERSQVYTGVEFNDDMSLAAQAVRDTQGLVCTWASRQGQRMFCTYYSSTCGGSTQAVGPVKNEPVIPPLRGDVVCDYCRSSAAYRWGPVRLDKSLITERLLSRYPAFSTIGPITKLQIVDATPTGRPVRLALVDEENQSVELEAENFRLAVDPTGRLLKSTWFTPVVEEGTIVFTDGRGFGHGMGLCQCGADGLARTGKDADEILRYYYPTSQLSRAY